MELRKQFHSIMGYQGFDRMPAWFFGSWAETKKRWAEEGLDLSRSKHAGSARPLEGSSGP